MKHTDCSNYKQQKESHAKFLYSNSSIKAREDFAKEKCNRTCKVKDDCQTSILKLLTE